MRGLIKLPRRSAFITPTNVTAPLALCPFFQVENVSKRVTIAIRVVNWLLVVKLLRIVFLPSPQKQLQEKINKNPRILDFLSIELRKRKRKKISGIFIFFRKHGLLLWLVRTQHDHYESKCKRKSGGIYLPFHYESECEKKNRQIFICNKFYVDGSMAGSFGSFSRMREDWAGFKRG